MVRFKVPAENEVLVKLGDGKIHTPSAELDILVWNVYKGQRVNAFAQDFKKLALNKDVIMLQEAQIDEKMPKIWAENFQSYEWHLAQSFKYKNDLYSTGVAIGSPLTPHKVDFLRSKFRELLMLTPKLTLFSEYEVGGQKVLFVCTHVLNFVPQAHFTATLYSISERIAQFQGPAVLAGDFNTWNLKRLMIMKTIFKDIGFDHIDLENDGRFLKLDHVFVRGLNVVDAKIHSEIMSSDHFPIDLKIKL